MLNSKRSSTVLKEIRQHLDSLIYTGFIRDMALSRIRHLPRYLKAISIRLDKLEHDPQKDDRKAAELRPFWQNYWEKRQTEKVVEQAMLDFRWILEEFRVSIFAQELKTAHPISLKRIEKLWKSLN